MIENHPWWFVPASPSLAKRSTGKSDIWSKATFGRFFFVPLTPSRPGGVCSLSSRRDQYKTPLSTHYPTMVKVLKLSPK